MFCKKSFLRNIGFPVNFAKFLRTPFLTEYFRQQLLYRTDKLTMMIIQSFIVIAKTSQRNIAIYVIYVTKFSNKFDINHAKSCSHVISNFKQYFSQYLLTYRMHLTHALSSPSISSH